MGNGEFVGVCAALHHPLAVEEMIFVLVCFIGQHTLEGLYNARDSSDQGRRATMAWNRLTPPPPPLPAPSIPPSPPHAATRSLVSHKMRTLTQILKVIALVYLLYKITI